MKGKWGAGSTRRFVFARAANDSSDKWKDKLSEQQKKMNRISQRMSARRSKKLGGQESYADKLKLFEIQQLEKRMTAMQSDIERNQQQRQQEEVEEQKRKMEERAVRRKTLQLENTFAQLEQRAGGAPRVDHAKAIETERKLKEVEDKLNARNRAKEMEMERKQEAMLSAMEKRMKELEQELEKDDDDMDEREMQRKMEQRRREEMEWEANMKRQREEREAERIRKKRDREAALDGQKKALEAKLKDLEQALAQKQQKRDDVTFSLKEAQVKAMTDRMAQMQAALDEGDEDAAAELERQRQELTAAERDAKLTYRERELKEREAKVAQLLEKSASLEALAAKMAKLEEMEDVINKIKSGAFAVAGGGRPADFRSGAELKKEIEECQRILMEGKATDQEIEAANIRLEKALDAYEKTSEFQQEQAAKRREKEEREAPKNKAALQKMKGIYTLNALKTNPELLDKVRKYPELRLIMMDGESIMKKHENDFKMFVLSGLPMDELRAIRGSLPKFRTDQKVQVQFVDNLDTKIDEMEVSRALLTFPQSNASKPKPAKKGPTKKLNLRAQPKAGGGAQDMLAELMAKRGGGSGGLKKSTGPKKKSMAEAASSGMGSMPPLPPMPMGGPMPPLPPMGGPSVMPPLPPPGPSASAPAPAASRGPPATLSSDVARSVVCSTCLICS